MTDTTDHTTYRPRTRSFIILGFVILALALALVAYWVSQVEPQKPNAVDEEVTVVELQNVTLADNQAEFSAGGFVRAKTNGKIAAETTGTVQSITPIFAVGNRVSKGAVLATIDKKNYIAAVANARANLAAAQSTYAQEQAQSRQAARDAKYLEIKPTNLLLRKPQLAAAKNAIANAAAQLKLARQNLAKTTVKAPFDAIIQARNISLGDTVNENTIVAQLVGLKTFTVKLNLDSNLFNLVGVGDSVTLNNPATGANYTATISRFDPILDETTRTVGAYVDIANPLAAENPLLLNTYLQANITGKTLPNTMWIDNAASVENTFVWAIADDNTLKKVPFTLFYRGDSRSLVRFNQAISQFVSNPTDGFFVGESVTTETEEKNPSPNEEPSKPQAIAQPISAGVAHG